ncbi:MAG: single-stranded-DNA-specific exonuclease RecJ [Candidatus Omnitrophica bacterium]|nr:single-stranded-DNA-specific exonuclease RecJ [Candidatus Omnitrophota bacterium]
MRSSWVVRAADEGLVERLTQDLEVAPLIASLLVQRGADSLEAAGNFLCADLSLLPRPELMADLPKAVALIRQAISRKERILLVGDYDVDGLTGTALLYRLLRGLGAEPLWHIPHRVDDGYGLKVALVRKAASWKTQLLIAVDCGTTSFEELSLAKSRGIETIVVDHHDLLRQGRPAASAFLNPLQPGCSYPGKDLASVGVAFTLGRGILQSVPGGGGIAGTVFDHLDLVALGTLADMAPLVGENRVLVKAGLHRLRGTSKPGLRALLSRAKIQGRALTGEDVSYTLAPRLNAMGRIGSAGESFRLLTTEDPEEAARLARLIDQGNRVRAMLERQAVQRALAKVERQVNFSQDRVIVLEDERWHPGVVGIVATRLTARFHRPAVVIAMSGAVGRGSARSIRAFHLVEALEEVKDHLIEFGGHPAAAGLTIARDRVPEFRQALNRVAHARMDPGRMAPSLEVDGELPLSGLSDQFMRDLDLLAPFGHGNPRPVFVAEDAMIPEERGKAGYSPFGIRFLVEDSHGRTFQALQPRQELADGWNVRKLPGGPIRLAYSPLRGLAGEGSGIELRLRDLKLP